MACHAAARGPAPFGVPWVTTRAAAYVEPGGGTRSLATVTLPAERITFAASWREGTPEPDVRVQLDGAGLHGRSLSVKDHFLLGRAEAVAADLESRLAELTALVSNLGPTVAVRLGLSRRVRDRPQPGRGVCWLMADGFFAFDNP